MKSIRVHALEGSMSLLGRVLRNSIVFIKKKKKMYRFTFFLQQEIQISASISSWMQLRIKMTEFGICLNRRRQLGLSWHHLL